MMRAINVLCLLSVITLLTALYHVRYSAEQQARSLEDLEAEIVKENQRTQTLRAEWSSLTDPARIQKLSRAHLGLDYASSDQLVAARHDPAFKTVRVLNIETAEVR